MIEPFETWPCYDLKEKASQLQGSERLLFAEKTALAFWKAIGGEDEDGSDGTPGSQ